MYIMQSIIQNNRKNIAKPPKFNKNFYFNSTDLQVYILEIKLVVNAILH